MRHLAHWLASHWLEPGIEMQALDEKYRLPLFFPLRDFEKKIEPYIVDQFSKEGITDIDFPGFLGRIANDELVILLDGFDEMTQKIDADEKARNFEKIRRVIDSSEKSKIILTVRQEYFQSAEDIESVFRHRDKANYQLVHLLPFDDSQIRQYLETHTDDPGHYWKQIKTVFDLHDLAKRPVLLQLIVDYLPKVIEEKGKNKPIAASDLYDKCIEGELRRKSSELVLIIPNKYRREILEKLAVWMFEHDQLHFDTGSSEILGLLKRYFKTELEWEYEKYLNEFLTFSFLIREADYQYRISHKSFRDYLTARAFIREVNTREIEHFVKYRITEEIKHFMVEQVGQNVEKKKTMEVLLNLVLKSRIDNLNEVNQWQGTNATDILLKIDRSILKNRNLSRCRLSFIDFRNCDLTGTDFSEADLSDCLFDQTVLTARFQNTNAANSRLNLRDCGLTDIAFLKELKNLSYLDLAWNDLAEITTLKELKKLTELYLNNNQLTEISALKELKNLNRLDLDDNQLTEITALKDLKDLNKLYLRGNHLSEIPPLKELKNLTHLYLYNNKLSEITPLKELKKLTHLSLGSNKITEITALKDLKNLTELRLSNNRITEITILKKLKNLKYLNVENNPLTTG